MEEPVVHLAVCDLCDSRIYGDRYASRPMSFSPLGLSLFSSRNVFIAQILTSAYRVSGMGWTETLSFNDLYFVTA
jgi:hypothetical protein